MHTLFRTEGKPAPGELIRVHGFLNTWSDELGIEDFSTPQSTEKWLRDAGLWEGNKKMNEDEHRRILAFRGQVRRCVLRQDSPERLTDTISHVSFRLRFEEDHPALIPVTRSSCDRVIGLLIAIIYRSMIDGTWVRFKCCALPTCGWAYYDTTKSRTKRWCSMQTCGSRNKARRYYERNR
ncbi:MAG: CGNR zinc finger domain-containing protein [Leptolyngbya sp. SIO1D8]|nr:CGNR zinc finger domain-containing protein [Leptolyngbya sp. SIO1D8]